MAADRTSGLPETSLKRRQKPGTDQDHLEPTPGPTMEPQPTPPGPGFQSGQAGLPDSKEREASGKSDERRWEEETGEHHEPDDSKEDPDKYRSHGPTPHRR